MPAFAPSCVGPDPACCVVTHCWRSSTWLTGDGTLLIDPGAPAPGSIEDLAGYISDPAGAGATAWLVTEAPVVPGEEFELQLHIWDTTDHAWDSTVLIDGFEWLLDPTEPNTDVEW